VYLFFSFLSSTQHTSIGEIWRQHEGSEKEFIGVSDVALIRIGNYFRVGAIKKNG
jgi:hypothetical protein